MDFITKAKKHKNERYILQFYLPGQDKKNTTENLGLEFFEIKNKYKSV